jgi:hypothetical protein
MYGCAILPAYGAAAAGWKIALWYPARSSIRTGASARHSVPLRERARRPRPAHARSCRRLGLTPADGDTLDRRASSKNSDSDPTGPHGRHAIETMLQSIAPRRPPATGLLGVIAVVADLPGAAAADPAPRTIQAEHGVVCSLPGERLGYFGWPTVARMDDGTLLVASSGLRSAHICPFGKTVLNVSRDDGRSWSQPRVIQDSPIDDRLPPRALRRSHAHRAARRCGLEAPRAGARRHRHPDRQALGGAGQRRPVGDRTRRTAAPLLSRLVARRHEGRKRRRLHGREPRRRRHVDEARARAREAARLARQPSAARNMQLRHRAGCHRPRYARPPGGRKPWSAARFFRRPRAGLRADPP